ncbi:hypothetical protein Trydic_g19219 [Trypoxylus dichotomus]
MCASCRKRDRYRKFQGQLKYREVQRETLKNEEDEKPVRRTLYRTYDKRIEASDFYPFQYNSDGQDFVNPNEIISAFDTKFITLLIFPCPEYIKVSHPSSGPRPVLQSCSTINRRWCRGQSCWRTPGDVFCIGPQSHTSSLGSARPHLIRLIFTRATPVLMRFNIFQVPKLRKIPPERLSNSSQFVYPKGRQEIAP